MKILYINRKKFDYIQDLIYAGLVKNIGAENIIESPWNYKFHWNYRPYPKNIAQTKNTFFKSLITKFTTKVYDIVIVSSCHPETITNYANILSDISSDVVTIFIDGGDGFDVGGDFERVGGRETYEKVIKKRPFDLIFKREYCLDRKYPDNVFALPMCFDFNNLPSLNGVFKYDVAFWAVESHEIRTKVLDLLSDKFDCSDNGSIKQQQLNKYKRKGMFYLQELAACKVSINFRGAGWDTLRYWEIAALGGFMISQRPQIKIENNYIDGEEIVYCKDDLSDLVELCEYYLKHDEERIRIGKNAQIKTKKYHTDEVRAKFILDKTIEFQNQ